MDEVEWKCVEGGEVEKLRVEVKKLVVEAKRFKGKGKRKRNEMRRYFLLNSKNHNIERTDTRVQVEDTENISENTEIVRNSSISERPEINIKNQ